MAGSLYNADNVVVGHAVLWLKPWVYGVTTNPVPDDTTLWNVTVWEAAGFYSAGATSEGFKIVAETSTTTVTIEEQSTPVDERLEGKNVNIEAALAEDTLESMSYAWGGGTIVAQAATNLLVGTQKMSLVNDIKYFVACLEMKNFKGLPRRIFVPKMSLTGSGDTSFRRSSDKRTYPVRLASLCKPTDIQVIDVTAPKTA
jgi:hypothetical protein